MDTPERNQIGAPISKFEDSPVFNYINSLSPIKPVQSIHITHTFNPLNFSSLPSVFTSPHVNLNKESRFVKRYNCLDLSKPEFSSENGNKVCTNEGIGTDAAQLYDNSAELQENFDSGVSIGESSVEPSTEHSKFAIELPGTLKYDCGSPECDPTPHCGTGTGCVLKLAGKSVSLIQYGQEASANGSSEGEVHLSEMCRIDEQKGVECDWESLISDATDILIFNSPNDSEAFKGLIQKSMDPMTRFCTSVMSQLSQDDIDNVQTMHIVDPVGSGEQHEIDDPSAEHEEGSELQEIDQTQDNPADTNLNKCMSSGTSENMDSEVGTCIPYASKSVSNLHRGMRRRCLDFEMAGARRKNLGDGSNCSSILSPSDEKIACHDKQLVPIKPSGDSSRCMLPGIGLHLNALATTSKDHKNVKLENLSSGRQLYLPISTASFPSPTDTQEPLNKSLTSPSSERDADLPENGVSHVEDASQAAVYLVSDDFNQNSPKKKRRRLEHAGESESCKRCNCKKSKCLKLYCECFAAGVYCIEPCSCLECFNKPIHEDTVLATRKQIESRNPLAFAPKVIRSSDSITEIGEESSKTPASARHKRGCNCKKSNCLKKYCECYQGGVGCSIGCRCEGCKNAFGRKDGAEVEQEEETEACENSAVDKALQKSEIQNNEEQNPASALPTTPLRLSRSLVQLPFSSNGKPPRSSFLTVGSSSGLYSSQKLGKPNILRSLPKFEKHFQTTPEDEMPEILRGNCSPSTGIKSASPNSKRVSPPHSNFGSSPSRRSGRKLILQSIPSFPSLTPQH